MSAVASGPGRLRRSARAACSCLSAASDTPQKLCQPSTEVVNRAGGRIDDGEAFPTDLAPGNLATGAPLSNVAAHRTHGAGPTGVTEPATPLVFPVKVDAARRIISHARIIDCTRTLFQSTKRAPPDGLRLAGDAEGLSVVAARVGGCAEEYGRQKYRAFAESLSQRSEMAMGEQIKAVREHHVWGQSQLARKAIVSPNDFDQINSGTPPSRMATIRRVTEALGVESAALVSDRTPSKST